MAATSKKTIYEKKGPIAYLTINNPTKANVMDDQVIEELGEAYQDYWADTEMRCLILTAVGDRHFSGGHSIQPPPPGETFEDERARRLNGFVWPRAGTIGGRRIAVFNGGVDFPQIWKPVIAAINGWAAGAGLYSLLTTTDIRIACAEHARFYYALLSNRGGIGSGPLATRLIRQVPYVHAMRMLLSDQPIDAAEAARISLVNEAVPHDQLMPHCEEIANRIAEMPPVAVRFLKEFLTKSRDMTEDQAWHLQLLYNGITWQITEDAADASAAFLEKRPRNVTGQLRTGPSQAPEG
jgi:enoyl-CoA hydratase/carnithine racemase